MLHLKNCLFWISLEIIGLELSPCESGGEEVPRVVKTSLVGEKCEFSEEIGLSSSKNFINYSSISDNAVFEDLKAYFFFKMFILTLLEHIHFFAQYQYISEFMCTENRNLAIEPFLWTDFSHEPRAWPFEIYSFLLFQETLK